PEEVRAALHRYLIGKPTVVVSVVPAGKRELAATGRTPDQIARESSFDRNAKPGAGPRPALHTPRVWRETFANGVRAIGTRGAEVPVTEILIAIPGGRRSESLDKLGVSSLTAQLMNEGTRKLSTTQLADALDALGATLQISSDDDELSLRLSALDKNLKASVALLGDALLEPRFDSADFDRMRKRRLVAIDTRGDSIRTVAGNAFRRLLYGDADVLGFPDDGTKATVSKLTLDDVKAFHAQALAPGRSRVAVVSALEPLAVRELLSPLMSRWKAPAGAPAADLAAASAARGAGIGRPGVIYLVDKPGASQSELRVGHVGIAKNDPDNDAVSVVNYVLGGAFSSRINMNLREAKGYTYGARTAFDGGLVAGPFFMSAGVKAGDTAPALTETLKELTAIGDGVKPEELAFAKSAMEQAMTGSFESPQARIRLVDDIAKFGYSDDVLEKRAGVIEGLTEVESKRLATKHIRTGDMVILVVGDKKQIGASLAESGKTVVELDIDGRTLEAEGRAPAGG
ncbi:MAG TPA: pitrilysin family protein, partial [Planctomycetota bacterium]|nr:pitrilysin family protein [Planctomycetota bacterium]